MKLIDKAIYDTNEVICINIKCFHAFDRGFLSQNVLSQLRNFTEYIAMKAHYKDENIDPNNQDLRECALRQMRRNGKLVFYLSFIKCYRSLHHIILLIKIIQNG